MMFYPVIPQDLRTVASPTFVDLNLSGYISTVDYIDFNTAATVTGQEARIWWDADYGTVSIGMPGGNVTGQVCQENIKRCRNTSGVEITNGQLVYITGSTGDFPEIAAANADSITTAYVAGMATEDIAINGFGYITLLGDVHDIDTDGFSYGVPVWLDTTDGTYTETRPDAPNIGVFIGYTVRAHATEGIITVKPTVIPRLSALSDVYLTSIADHDIIEWNSSNSRFENTNNPSFNELTITSPTGGDYVFQDCGGYLGLKNTVSGQCRINMHTADYDETDIIGIQMFSAGDCGETTNYSQLQMIFIPGSPGYWRIGTTNGGTGTAHDLRIFSTTSNLNQLFLDTSGFVGINTSTPATELDVDGTAHATQIELYDGEYALFGTSNDASIGFSGTNFNIATQSGYLILDAGFGGGGSGLIDVTNVGFMHQTKTVTAASSNSQGYDWCVLLDTSSNAVTYNLSATPETGRKINIKCIDATNTATVSGNGNNIDGSASIVLALHESITIIYDGTQWWII